VGGLDENAILARSLLADLVDRGLDPEQEILFVIDGGRPSGAGSRTRSAGALGSRLSRAKRSFGRRGG